MTYRVPQRVLRLLESEAWAVEEGALREMAAIALRLGEGPEALSSRLGRPLDNSQAVTLRDGVALLPVVGPIFSYANLFTEISGATSFDILARDLRTALDDPAVTAIVLQMDSPGGQVTGTAELAQHIQAARGQKPVEAYVGGQATSAAYWLASATDKITLNRTAAVGSIGVQIAVRGEAPASAAAAPTYRFISAQSPFKNVDPGSEAGRSKYQAMADRLAAEFVAAVADHRGVTPEQVMAEASAGGFGAGGLVIGSDAVAVGMADALGTLEDVISRLAANRQPSGRGMGLAAVTGGRSMSGSTTPAALTAETVASEHPQLAEHFRAEGRQAALATAQAEREAAVASARAEGAAAERERILGIEANALPGHDQLVAEMKADGRTTPEQAAVKILKAERETGSAHVTRLREGEREQPKVAAGQVPDAAAGGDFDSRCKAEFDKSPALQAEFRKAETYAAFKRSELERR
jgi:ClpP class serine protease